MITFDIDDIIKWLDNEMGRFNKISARHKLLAKCHTNLLMYKIEAQDKKYREFTNKNNWKELLFPAENE